MDDNQDQIDSQDDLQAQQDQLRQYLMSKYGSDLAQAQQVAAGNTFSDDMDRAAQRLGGAIAGSTVGPDDAYFKAQATQNELPVQIAQQQGQVAAQQYQMGRQAIADDRTQKEFDFKQGQEQRTQNQQSQNDDVNSASSKALQALASKYFPSQADQIGTMNATQLQPLIDTLEKTYGLDLKKQEVDEKNKELGIMHGMALDNKNAARDQKDAIALQNDLDPNKQRAGNFAQAAQRVQKAGSLQEMADQYANHNLPPNQIHELAIGLASLMGGTNAPPEGVIKSLVPQSAMGDAAALENWLTNNPGGTNQTKFVENMLDSIRREKNYWSNQIGQIQVQRLAAHSQLKKNNPDLYNSIVNQYGVGDDNVDPKGKFNPGWKDQVAGAGAAGIPLMNAPGLNRMVTVQAPDGTQASVPAARADYYVKKGGKLLGQ